MRRCLATALLVSLVALAPAGAQPQADPHFATPPSGVLGVEDAQLTPAYWVGQVKQPNHVLMSPPAIEAQNARLLVVDPTMHDLTKMPPQLARAQVRGWIEDLSKLTGHTLYDAAGKPLDQAALDGLQRSLALDAIPASAPTRYGLTVQRAPLRTFPTDVKVYNDADHDDRDIDRFQETAEFPGTPVVIAHASADGQWLFVVSPRYAAWTHKENVAEGDAGAVLAYAEKAPFRIITGAEDHTVYTPERPELSQLSLDMGTRVPLAQGLAPDQPVNGQTPYAAWTLDLPYRDASGKLAFAPALLQKNTASASAPLPLTRANIIDQAFKFLGERYGWGHDYDGRDCSGFVSDVYHSLGVQMPRNTSAQAKSPGLTHQAFGPGDSHDARVAAVRALDTGDLVYIPGHVMMVLGQRDGQPYVIHDVGGMTYQQPDGSLRSVKLNAVSVTPLLPMVTGHGKPYTDIMTSLVKVHPGGSVGEGVK